MADQATGTHTFLFSDIEGSTRRWQEHGPAMGDALKVHDATVAEAVESAGGRVFKHTGDGVCAVFSSAGGALAAAVGIQRGLDELDFSAVGGLAVRVGVHTGEAEEIGGDFFGPALNRTARLMGLAHGGQVLLSDATAALVGDAHVPGVELIPLGEHVLRDIARPERVHQLIAPGLRREVPPLRSGPATGNLPEPRTAFVGRADALARLAALLSERRLVTLVGVGGTGKTRLAVEVAHRLAPEFPAGVYFADLSPLTDGSLLFPTLAVALGLAVAEGGNTAIADTVVDFLRPRRSLVVLDNCEQIVDDCAEAVDRLLDSCPDLVVLATSREALDVEGEHSWPVTSLSVPEEGGDVAASEAVQLFADRARAAAGTFELTAENTADVVEICRRLDGIPLALELAASRVAHMSPGEIASRLDDRFHLLVGGRRRRAQRQQTLQAALDWSHDLLGPSEQVFLRRLSVFAGGFTLQAAAEVCVDDPTDVAVDLLASLVAKSLVVPEPTGDGTRYRMLETVRLYAAQKLLESGETERFRVRHRDRLLAWLESIPIDQTIDDYTVVGTLVADLDNLRVALDWSEDEGRVDLAIRMALRMSGLWAYSGHYEEGVARLQALAAAIDDVELEARCLGVLAFLAMYSARFELMDESARRCMELDPDGPLVALGLMFQALFWVYERERSEETHHMYAMARRRAHEEGLPQVATAAAAMEAHQYVSEGAYDAALAMKSDLPTWSSYSGFVFTLALVAAAICAERPEEALALSDFSAFGGFRAWGAYVYYEDMIRSLALVETGRIDDARATMVAAGRQLAERPGPLAVGDALICFAALAIHDDDPARATALLESVWNERGMSSYRSPASWTLSRRYRFAARDRLGPDEWEAAKARGRTMTAMEALQAELDRLG